MISKEEITRAFSGTSMVPEHRADLLLQEIENTLRRDYNLLYAEIRRGEQFDYLVNTLNEQFEQYKEGYLARYRAWLNAKSKTMSPTIAGYSKFPTRSNNEKLATEHKRLEELVKYRHVVLIKIRKKLHPEWRPIMSGDDDAIERLEKRIEYCAEMQRIMKEGNKIIRSKKLTHEEKVTELMKFKVKESAARNWLEPDDCGHYGFPPEFIRSNNAELRRLRKRLAELQPIKEAAIEHYGDLYEDGVSVEDNPPENRVRIFFIGKPDDATIKDLKEHGFRWSPTKECWQTYRNVHSITKAMGFINYEHKED